MECFSLDNIDSDISWITEVYADLGGLLAVSYTVLVC